MKLSLRINSPEDESGSMEGDSSRPDYKFEALTRVLEGELLKLYPEAQDYEFAEISMTFTDSDTIRELNRTYRNIDEATDVLSFPLLDDEPVEIPELPVLALGDIVICPEQVRMLHPELSEPEGICLMIAHSFLHLLGYDHDTDEKQSIMWQTQDEIQSRLLEAF